jgi:hypothetical protein
MRDYSQFYPRLKNINYSAILIFYLITEERLVFCDIPVDRKLKFSECSTNMFTANNFKMYNNYLQIHFFPKGHQCCSVQMPLYF